MPGWSSLWNLCTGYWMSISARTFAASKIKMCSKILISSENSPCLLSNHLKRQLLPSVPSPTSCSTAFLSLTPLFLFGLKIDFRGKRFCFLTNLPITLKNRAQLLIDGRRRWAIENQGFNTPKNHGFYLEHLFSRNGQAMKNHYLLIQIGHIISQFMDAWSKLWEGISISREQKHRCLLESWKHSRIQDFSWDHAPFRIRFL